MDQLLKFFPLSTQCSDSDTLIKNVVIYLVAGIVLGLVGALLTKIPVIGLILGIVFWVIDLYLVVGLVLAFLIYFNIVHS